MTAYRTLEASGQPRGPAALSPVHSGGWVGFKSNRHAFVERDWTAIVNMTIRNFAHPSATETGLYPSTPPLNDQKPHYHFYSLFIYVGGLRTTTRYNIRFDDKYP